MSSVGIMTSAGKNHFIDHQEALPCEPSSLAKAALGLNLVFLFAMTICLVLYVWVAHYRKGRRCHFCTGVRWCVCEEDDNNDDAGVAYRYNMSGVRNTMVASDVDVTDSIGAVHVPNKSKTKTLTKSLSSSAAAAAGGQIKDVGWDP